jgi:hypothetical protein
MRLDTKTLKAGDTAYIGKPGSWDNNYVSGEVTKVTASGQVSVKMAGGDIWRFTPHGELMGSSSKWSIPFLIDKESYDKVVAYQKLKAQRQAFERDVRDLQAKLNEGYEPFIDECHRLVALAKIHLK